MPQDPKKELLIEGADAVPLEASFGKAGVDC